MKIGGFQKVSLIDYPGKIAAIVFTQGCNMLCSYCHNLQLVKPELFEKTFNENEILEFLKKRKRLLQGVVISGGEPTLQSDLKFFIARLKDMGYSVKLDTNGSSPNILEELINKNLIDFAAMDIKAPFEKYKLFNGANLGSIKRSIEILKSSKIQHLFRTTFDTEILTESDLEEIKKIVYPSNYAVQEKREIVNKH
ncbi:MAG: anaerobic ribonucleoside-triphosphate reductase activating protein [Elusimicrobiota bacterium]|jgi:pyruvate formate lyase activating enzyme|nr:anaerobic ribonucleoside-triphosphate reductase activating protein [Elusimicrobiota bacterium]